MISIESSSSLLVTHSASSTSCHGGLSEASGDRSTDLSDHRSFDAGSIDRSPLGPTGVPEFGAAVARAAAAMAPSARVPWGHTQGKTMGPWGGSKPTLGCPPAEPPSLPSAAFRAEQAEDGGRGGSAAGEGWGGWGGADERARGRESEGKTDRQAERERERETESAN